MKKLTIFLLLILLAFQSNSQNLWTLSTPLPGISRAGAISFSLGNEAYYGTGYGSDLLVKKDMWKFNSTTHLWTQLNDFPINVYNATVFYLNDTIYVTNGWQNTSGNANSNTYKYIASTDTFVQVSAYPGTPAYTTMSFVINNKAYVGIGYSPLTNEIWMYDPTLDTWTQKSNFPGTMRQNCSAFNLEETAYVGLGALNPVVAYNDFWAYNSNTDTWTQIPSIPGGGRFDGINFMLNGKIYTGCGYDFSNYFKDMWSYDPFTNSWNQENDYGGLARYSGIEFTLGNSVFAGSGRAASYHNDLWEFTPSHPNKIQGLAYRDNNSNAIYDAPDLPFSNLLVEVNPGGLIYSSANNGIFNALADTGTYNITIPNLPLYYTYSNTNSVTFNSTGLTDTSTKINLIPTGTINDLEITLTPLTPPKPGNAEVFNLACTNRGTTDALNVNLLTVLDSLLSYYMVVPNENNLAQSGDSITLAIATLAPGEQKSYMIYTTVNSTATLTDSISFYGSTNSALSDQTPTNNETTSTIAVVSSFDPNDISVTPAGSITPQQVSNGQWLTYTIRFQNTGTASADEVRVLNEISTDLDLSSFEMLSSSHNYKLILNGDRKVKWLFKHIQLADSNANEAASHGFIQYRIKAKTTLTLGDNIHNTADIYFDYNAAVATNVTSTPIQLAAGLTNIETNTNLTSIYPNPTSGIVNITSDISLKSVDLYDVAGKMIAKELPIQRNSINLTSYQQGFYFLKIITINNSISIHKITIAK